MRLGQTDEFLSLTLELVTRLVPERVPLAKVFDMQLLCLSLLVNLVEHCNANRRLLVALTVRLRLEAGETSEAKATLPALVSLFGHHLGRAQRVEAEVDRKLEDGAAAAVAKAKNRPQAEETALAESVDAAMVEAGAHMEEGIMAAYVALLLGFLLLQNEYLVPQLRDLLPDHSFKPLLKSLQALFDFMELTVRVRERGCGYRNLVSLPQLITPKRRRFF